MKINSIIIFIFVSELVLSIIFMSDFNIFQHMIFIEIMPSLLLAILIGRVAYGKKLLWLYMLIGSIIYAILEYILITITPMQIIENNTIQSSTSVFEFSKNIKITTYFGMFIQSFLLSSFVVLIIKVIKKIKKGEF
ncbi:hypothetical protein [Mammaliicoccus fleurettii]|uniref:hypothetical protein n=3 Tax=Mammaliicoccus fleurettii TaxID=150056 RepID=UPI0009931FE4|nr:hypothetical protein [Mammaliicoccus fleurettii]MBO3063777.1 hypothetical protein [Mammaliicoccus fleurettii]